MMAYSFTLASAGLDPTRDKIVISKIAFIGIYFRTNLKVKPSVYCPFGREKFSYAKFLHQAKRERAHGKAYSPSTFIKKNLFSVLNKFFLVRQNHKLLIFKINLKPNIYQAL